MKKFLKLLMVIAVLAALLAVVAACGSDDEDAATPDEVATPAPPPETPPPGEDGDVEVDAGDERLTRNNLDENLRFNDPVTIRPMLWDRSSDRVPEFAEGYWAQWVSSNILEDHNIVLDWVQVPRWDQEPFLSTLLGAGDAPDVSFTFGFGMVETFAQMDGIMDLAPLLREYNDWLPNMYGLVGSNVYWNLNPDTGELFAIANRMVADGRVNTFVREDWLNTLNIAPPTNLQEFEDMLIAFRDNADTLLGADANRMIPFRLTDDVGWTADPLISSFIPDNITERDFFVHGFDDRRFMMPGMQDGLRVLNRWFHEDLLWNDFPLYSAGDDIIDDQIILGFVGAFSHNWDYPFRQDPGVIVRMQEETGNPDANFIVVNPFPNDAGNIVHYMPGSTDRTIFFPATNNEPVASLLYLDWMSRLSTRSMLAFGYEGVHHVRHANGAFELLPAEVHTFELDADGEPVLDEDGDPIILETHFNWPDHQHIPSLRNFDISLMINGVELGDPALNAATVALGYPGIDSARIADARNAGLDHARIARRVQLRPIAAQEGMSDPLSNERDRIFAVLITATTPENFDSAWTTMFQGYLNMGGQAILNEREQAWIEQFGDVDFQNGPDWFETTH
ncbi:MAG: hypothetical protein FWE11_00665 [Defluviitaleaceae bacterium]|nr:hypothetical protein [Defluviitaleaceae bacterium]